MRNALALIQFFVRVAVWSLALLLIFENLGFDVTALVAGLGVGGIAVALAAQSVLGDLFSSLAIVLDRPFEVGDFIVFGDQNGTVEKIGIKTTRIRSLSGEQIACSNTDLVEVAHPQLQTHERAPRSCWYSASPTTRQPASWSASHRCVEEIIENARNARFDRAHFRSFGDSALEFEVVYWVQSADYTVYMDVQQAINFATLRAFEDEAIEFAFPSQTLYVPGLKAALSAMAEATQGEPPVRLKRAAANNGKRLPAT